jgi:phenylpyruvate tautomerase PptA (4-oxalocrotonate tautomerase family)
MPLLKLETNAAVSGDKRQTLLAALSKTVAEVIGKPEQYVMVSIGEAALLMSGNAGDAAWVDIRSIGGLNGEVNRRLTEQLSQLLKESLGISPNRVYVNFTEVEPGNWGWNGSTFG